MCPAAAQRKTSKLPLLASAMKACHIRAEYESRGPDGSTESRTMIVPAVGATSTHAPLATLRRDLRQVAFGMSVTVDDMYVNLALS